MIEINKDDKTHKITAPKTIAKQMLSQMSSYYDPEKIVGWSRKKKKFVLKYPRRTFWKKYWMRRKKLNKSKTIKKHAKKEEKK